MFSCWLIIFSVRQKFQSEVTPQLGAQRVFRLPIYTKSLREDFSHCLDFSVQLAFFESDSTWFRLLEHLPECSVPLDSTGLLDWTFGSLKSEDTTHNNKYKKFY